ncbi:hypothetical protein IDH50_07070 [Aeromicrobium tamlense]|uniref:Uncharacterized protein n=1 Tax=Aeromicrobium tamlense TaxID=375541 RepID=A0A8I0FTF2_9ACTN|nr:MULTISPECIES: hypothetical protein [Aeromicrobium]MBD1269985.1 hypothetical protein [Aeromicrobium tamlense]NYI39358.1 hypothetical protein [Aeromicrobium tamlense]
MELTRRRWYLVAGLLAALAWIAGTAFAASAWDPLREAEVVPVGQPIQANGSDDLAVLTDLPQPERAISCVARNGKERTPVPPATVDIVVDSDGSRWHLIGVLSDAPDETRIVCRPDDKQTDTARYGTALVDLESRVGTGRAIAWTGLIAGLGLAGATLTARTRRILAHD